MCGIAGIASFKREAVPEEAVKKMAAALGHRGPDDEGCCFSWDQGPGGRLHVGLGHKRLSIIDIKGGHQPMSNADKTIWTVYNGEIYNFPQIREYLKGKGYKFRTASDTEVLISLYEEEGIGCLHRLRGMFAFCIWDVKGEKLFMARDRMGQKPLFYAQKEGAFLFGSEIKAILEDSGIKREVDLTSLDQYLTYGYTPSPRTMFRGICQIPPAHYLLYDGKDVKIEKYWSLSYKEKVDLGFEECRDRLYGLLLEATKMRLISDVPLGAFLSGGVDSSCIVALMAQLSDKRVRTFSIGFGERDFDELQYAKEISDRFNTHHREFIVEPEAVNVLPKLAWHYDQPFGDSSCIPAYYVSKMTREFVTVALTGDGGDESFAGYHRYKGMKLAQRLALVPEWAIRSGLGLAEFINARVVSESKSTSLNHIRRFLEPLTKGLGVLDTYIEWLNYFNTDSRFSLYTNRTRTELVGKSARSYLGGIFAGSDADDIIERIMNTDILSYLPEDLLVKVDRASMANSLEARSPFLDHKVAESASMPLRYKLADQDGKRILKKAFSKEIPLSFLNRKKKGFGVPVGRWFSKELKGFVDDMLLDKESVKRGIFSERYIKRLLSEHRDKKRDHTHRIWALLSFEMWHRIFIDKKAL
jgi:asparagine synthase (glutamine-hydrolysing)